VVDTNRRAAILAYRSTMSLPQRFREFIKQAEVETNALMAARVRACIQAGLFRDIDVELTSSHLVMYAHTWALKHWRLSRLFDVDSYIDKGFDFFVHAMATPKGLAQYKRFLSSNGTSRN
jgi:homoserine acetyltransferase